jgi:hypothetical protein
MATKAKRSPAQRAATAKLVALNRARKRNPAPKLSKLQKALRHLNDSIAKGYEFPDALFSVSQSHGVSYQRLQALYDAQDRPKKNPERRSDPTMRRGLGYAVLADSTTVVGVFALQGDARTFAQAIADQTDKQLRVVPGAYTFTPDAR